MIPRWSHWCYLYHIHLALLLNQSYLRLILSSHFAYCVFYFAVLNLMSHLIWSSGVSTSSSANTVTHALKLLMKSLALNIWTLFLFKSPTVEFTYSIRLCYSIIQDVIQVYFVIYEASYFCTDALCHLLLLFFYQQRFDFMLMIYFSNAFILFFAISHGGAAVFRNGLIGVYGIPLQFAIL